MGYSALRFLQPTTHASLQREGRFRISGASARAPIDAMLQGLTIVRSTNHKSDTINNELTVRIVNLFNQLD